MRRLLWSLLVFILVILACLTLLVTTNTGLRLSFDAINRFTSIKIQTKNLKGAIIGAISAKNINIKTDTGDIRITNFKIHYNLIPLLWKSVTINTFNMGSLVAKFQDSPTPKEEKPEKKSGGNSLPTIVVKHASIGLINIQSGKDSRPIHARDIHWQGHFSKEKIDATLQLGPVTNLFKSADLSISGPINDYKIQASIVNKYTKMGANGTGNEHSINVLLFSESKKASNISGTVLLSWKDGIKWSTSLQLENINTRPLLLKGPMINSLSATSNGQLNKELKNISWQFSAKTSAGNIQSQGNYSHKSLSLNWDISNLNPQPFYPALQGTINTSGKWNNGKTSGMLSLSRIEFQDTRINNLQGNWDIDVAKQIINLFTINFQGIGNPDTIIPSGRVNFGKTINRSSSFAINIKLDPDKAPLKSLNLTGNITKGSHDYSIHLKKFDINALLKKWKLKKSVYFTLTPANQKTNTGMTWKQTPLCLVHKNAHLCEDSKSDATGWEAAIQAKNLPMENIKDVTNLKLPTNIDAKFYQKGDDPLLGEAVVRIPKASVTFTEFDVEKEVKLRNTRLAIKLLPEKIELNSSSSWEKSDYWKITGSMNRPGADEKKPNNNINANIRFSAKDLGFINSLNEIADIHSGSIDGSIDISGNLSKPQVNGQINLNRANVEILPVSNTISNLHGRITLKRKSIAAKITGKTKTAPLTITADAKFGEESNGLSAKFKVFGKNIQLADSDNYTAVGTVNLTGALLHNNLSLKGEVDIPTATISPASVAASAAVLPPDVIIIGHEAKKGMESTLNILIKLGRKVEIKTKELYARLTGELRITKEKESDPVGVGSIFIENGKVSAFDLKLQIAQNSNISFDNSPLTSPFINVKVFRVLKAGGFGVSTLSDNTNLTVGISAMGRYENLAVTLYSLPVQLSQADILSYLILGHPGNSSSPFNMAALMATVGSLSSGNLGAGLGKLMSIKKTLGFSELGVQSSLSLDALGTPYGQDQSGFVVGRYITPSIYVRYISGISSQVNLFQLQYYFTPHWSVQLQSGNVETTNVEGADMLYHFTQFSSGGKKKS